VTRRAFADELQDASDRIADISRADLAIILRRAALWLRNSEDVSLDPAWEDALASVAQEMKLSRGEFIRTIVNDWLVANSYLPVHLVDEDSEVDGNA